MSTSISHSIQNAYADLQAACLAYAFDGKGISFNRKKIRGKTYIYVATKIGATPVQKYLGPDNEQTKNLIEKEKALWANGEAERTHRARLVNAVLAGGIIGPSPQEGKVLKMLERTGIFLAGAVLIGTPAFRALGAPLGVNWEGSTSTSDIDIAADFRLPIALNQKPINLKEAILESGLGFLEVPSLNRKHPTTRYKLRGGEFLVELLTPEIGKPSTAPVSIPYLNVKAEPIRFLDYLLEETQPIAIPFDIGILVNVPNPARFAIHKLVVSQRRPSAFASKSKKDIDQANQLLEVLFTSAPGSVIAAVDSAREMGKKFFTQYQTAAKLLPKETQDQLEEWTN